MSISILNPVWLTHQTPSKSFAKSNQEDLNQVYIFFCNSVVVMNTFSFYVVWEKRKNRETIKLLFDLKIYNPHFFSVYHGGNIPVIKFYSHLIYVTHTIKSWELSYSWDFFAPNIFHISREKCANLHSTYPSDGSTVSIY